MDDAVLPSALLAIALVAAVVLVAGLVERRRLRAQVEAAWRDVPRDPATGLFDRRACLPRLAAELKRAARGSGSVWVGVVTVADGDPDRFGRLLHDGLRVPEVAFRLSDRVVCLVRPDLRRELRDDLIGRIGASGPRERLVLGEATWRSVQDGDAAALLQAASEAMLERA